MLLLSSCIWYVLIKFMALYILVPFEVPLRPCWGPIEVLLVIYFKDMTFLVIECDYSVFFGGDEFIIFPVWAKKLANTLSSAPRGFPRSIKYTHPGGRLPHPFGGHGVMLRIALFTSWASARWLECHEVKSHISHIISHLLNMASLFQFSFSLNFAISTSKRGNSSSDHGPGKHRVATHTILGLVATALDHAPGLLSYACSWTRQTRAVHKRKHLHLRQIGEWPKWMWKDVENSCQWTNNICHTSARTALDCTCRTEWRLGTNLESLELRTARLPVMDWFIPSNNGVAGVTLWARMTAKQRFEMTL